MSRLLLEKGAALIRSFEAGTRAGMTHMSWGGPQVQRLLVETAKQPDILYIAITDDKGTVLVDSNPENFGQRFQVRPLPADLDVSQRLHYRIVELPDGKKAFEVYRRFMPTQPKMRWGGYMMRRGMMMGGPRGQFEGREERGEGGGPQFNPPPPPEDEGEAIQYIFVGLDMELIATAEKDALKHAVVMVAITLLIGLAGMVSIFLAQGFRAARKSLARVQAFSDHVVEKMPLGLIAVDEEGRVAAFNENAENILNNRAEEIIGQPAETSLPAFIKSIQQRIRSAGAIVEEDMEITLPEHTAPLPLRISGAILKDETGASMGNVIIFRDLSEVRRLEREIERSRRLASVGSLAAGVAHEIRNPLSSIKGFATYFKERYKDHEQDRETAGIMIQEVERLDRVISQLLEFARPSALDIKPVAINDLISHSLRLIEGDARSKQISVVSKIDPEIDQFPLDSDRMNQALLNLYLNALQAMDKQGVLTVTVAKTSGNNQIRIDVTDTGKGIDPEKKERIFDPYFTTKSDGTGLGLPIVHKVIEAHGGMITVKSAPDSGTTFSLFIPAPHGEGNDVQ